MNAALCQSVYKSFNKRFKTQFPSSRVAGCQTTCVQSVIIITAWKPRLKTCLIDLLQQNCIFLAKGNIFLHQIVNKSIICPESNLSSPSLHWINRVISPSIRTTSRKWDISWHNPEEQWITMLFHAFPAHITGTRRTANRNCSNTILDWISNTGFANGSLVDFASAGFSSL